MRFYLGRPEARGGPACLELLWDHRLAQHVPARTGAMTFLGGAADFGNPKGICALGRARCLSSRCRWRELPHPCPDSQMLGQAAIQVVVKKEGAGGFQEGFRLRTETQEWHLLQTDLGRAPGHRTLQCGTYALGQWGGIDTGGMWRLAWQNRARPRHRRKQRR